MAQNNQIDVIRYLNTPWHPTANSFKKGMNCSIMGVNIQYDLGVQVPLPPDICDLNSHGGLRELIESMYDYFHESDEWVIVDDYGHGDVVVMSEIKSISGLPSHIGTYLDIDGGKILHTMRVLGARFNQTHEIKQFGFKIIEIWRCQK